MFEGGFKILRPVFVYVSGLNQKSGFGGTTLVHMSRYYISMSKLWLPSILQYCTADAIVQFHATDFFKKSNHWNLWSNKFYNWLFFTTLHKNHDPQKFNLHAWVKKVPFWQFFRKVLFKLSMKINSFLIQMISFEVVKNSQLQNLFIKCLWLRPSADLSG